MTKQVAPINPDSDKFMLRLPDGLRNRLKRAADRNRRSMNGEAIFAIENYIAAAEELAS